MNFIRNISIQAGRNVMILSCLVFVTINKLYGTGENFPIGTRPAALANTYVTQADIWSVYHNQAGLGFHNNLSLGFHHENKFVVPEFSLHALGLTVPVKPGTIGFSYSYFGFEDYNVSKFGLGFGKSFGSDFSAGVQLNYHYIFIAGDYGNQGTLSVEGGIQYRPTENFTVGAHVFNPTRSQFPYEQDYTLSTSFKTGIGYTPVEKLFLGVEVEKHPNRNPIFKSGIEYRIIESLYLRTGISTNPTTNTFGLGYKMGKISADIAFTHHQILGFTPHFSLQIEW